MKEDFTGLDYESRELRLCRDRGQHYDQFRDRQRKLRIVLCGVW